MILFNLSTYSVIPRRRTIKVLNICFPFLFCHCLLTLLSFIASQLKHPTIHNSLFPLYVCAFPRLSPSHSLQGIGHRNIWDRQSTKTSSVFLQASQTLSSAVPARHGRSAETFEVQFSKHYSAVLSARCSVHFAVCLVRCIFSSLQCCVCRKCLQCLRRVTI